MYQVELFGCKVTEFTANMDSTEVLLDGLTKMRVPYKMIVLNVDDDKFLLAALSASPKKCPNVTGIW